MQLFRHAEALTIGALIDVGSASVLVSYVASSPKSAVPLIIWSHREHIPLRENADIDQLAKNLNSAFVNALLLLDANGRKVLDQALPGHPQPSFLRVTVAAPWSYTVTKTITYTADEPFVVNADLVAELERTAESKIIDDFREHEVLAELGLVTTTRSTIALIGNGYPINQACGQTAANLALARINCLIHGYLDETIHQAHEELLPRCRLEVSSFMFGYYLVVKSLYPELTEYCLVDITYEATEIGVVRDSTLQYCTHLSYGAFSLARDLSALTKVPLQEAYGLLSSRDFLNDTQNSEGVAKLLTDYEAKIGELLKETGDTLSIPKTILLHSNLETEDFFLCRVKEGALLATGTDHRVITISRNIIENYYTPDSTKDLRTRHDTALLISAQFFHITHLGSPIEWP